MRVFNPFWLRGPLGISRLFEYLGDAYFNVRSNSDFADLNLLAAEPVVAQISHSFDEYWSSDVAVPIAEFARVAPSAADRDRALSRMADNAERFRNTNYAQALRAAGFGTLVREGRVPLVPVQATVFDAPAQSGVVDLHRPIATAVTQFILGAQQDVMLIAPYFIPGTSSANILCELTRRGVRVRILTKTLTSTGAPVVHPHPTLTEAFGLAALGAR